LKRLYRVIIRLLHVQHLWIARAITKDKALKHFLIKATSNITGFLWEPNFRLQLPWNDKYI
jgi:hypothetical protein